MLTLQCANAFTQSKPRASSKADTRQLFMDQQCECKALSLQRNFHFLYQDLIWLVLCPIDNALTNAGMKALASDGDIAKSFVQYDKKEMSAPEILGFIAKNFLPVGIGQSFSKGLQQVVRDSSAWEKGQSYIPSQLQQYYRGKMDEYRLMANQMSFEMSSVVEQILAAAKNPV